jgi:hypothetical protein
MNNNNVVIFQGVNIYQDGELVEQFVWCLN